MRSVLGVLCAFGGLAFGGTCTESPGYYAEHGYRIRDVRIETPLGRIGPVRRQIAAVEQTLTAAGRRFTTAEFSRSFSRVTDAFRELDVAAGERIRLAVVIPRIENCTDSQLDVVHRVYASDTVFALASVLEGWSGGITRALAPGAAADDTGRILPRPFVAFNSSRGLFGGTAASFRSETPVIQRVDAGAAIGNGNFVSSFALSGNHSFASGFLGNAEWRFGHRYTDLPAGTPELRAEAPGESLSSVRSGVGFAQISAATNPLGQLGTVIRFGSAIEGGNQRVYGSFSGAAPAVSRYGAVKAFAGASFSAGMHAFSASYGVQFGSSGRDIGHSYTKHVIDVRHTGRILARDHFAIRPEVAFAAGAITGAAAGVPVAERFRGGNVAREFIDGENWRIRAGPLIRSFPEGTLLRTGDGATGGTNFFSLNFTLGVPVWAYPAVPREIGSDPDVRIALTGAMGGAKQGTILSYLGETDEFRKLSAAIGSIGETLRGVAAEARAAMDLQLAEELRTRIQEFALAEDEDDLVHDAIESAAEAQKSFEKVRYFVAGFDGVPGVVEEIEEELAGIVEDMTAAGVEPGGFKKLLADLGERRAAAAGLYETVRGLTAIPDEPVAAAKAVLPEILETVHKAESAIASVPKDKTARLRRYLEATASAANLAEEPDAQATISDLDRLATGYGEITGPLLGAVREELLGLGLNALADDFADQQRRLRAAVTRIPRPNVERKALRDLAYTGRTLDVVFRELNLFSAGPVILFDAARIGSATGRNPAGMRYGIGGGIRVSIVSLDLTLGYSRNPSPKPWEPKGALFFSLDVADLFR